MKRQTAVDAAVKPLDHDPTELRSAEDVFADFPVIDSPEGDLEINDSTLGEMIREGSL
jgi:hypothetical protein